jgi:signal peptide peptidase SppA
MTHLIHVADRVLGRPLLCLPEKVETILAVLAGRIGLEEIDGPLPWASRFAGAPSDRGPYRVTKEGIAVISIVGTLVNRGAYIGASSGLTSYEGITEQLKKAGKDPEVRGIVLDIASPGGEAGGALEVPALIREIRKSKPVVVAVNDMACSAAYAIASGANEIFVTQTSLVGSIGVVLVHLDRSGELEKAGIKATLIHAGAQKVDGNPFGPLPKEVRARLQAEVDTLRELFIETVVAGRPKLKAEAVRATEARVYTGEAAVERGLADGIFTSFDNVLETVSRSVSRLPKPPTGYNPKLETTTMTDTPAPTPAPAPLPDAAAIETARASARKEGAAAERARIQAILALPEAEGRAGLASHLATATDMAVEEAKKALAAAPKEAAGGKPADFYKAVADNGGNPKVPLAGADDGGKKPSGLVAGMQKRFAKA